MGRPFDYFVVFAEMRTGSNLLEEWLNQFDGVTCHGEAFNPSFIGYPKTADLLGVTQEERDADPARLLNAIRQADGISGFRFFHDHEPRILPTLLTDHRCAKVVLTRNPLDSYVSLKIARATNQWKLTNPNKRRDARAVFDAAEFQRFVAELQTFQLDLLKALQVTGQTAFYVGYDDLSDREVMEGLAQWLGTSLPPDSERSNLKPQNPQSLQEKVENYEKMEAALRDFDTFALARTPNFEPRRGPVVPTYAACAHVPLIYMPVRSGPEEAILSWMASLGNDGDPLISDFSQKTLRLWMRKHPGHRGFTVLRHPLARAHAAFCDRLVSTGPGSFARIRNKLRRHHGIDLTGHDIGPAVDKDRHKGAFMAFLKFLKLNLAGQTGIRVDAHWASQAEILKGFSGFCLPDVILREEDCPRELPSLASRLGVRHVADLPPLAHPMQPLLESVYDPEMEALCRDVYSRDYELFGFSDFA